MLKQLLLFSMLFGLINNAVAQSVFQKVYRSANNAVYEQVSVIKPLADGNYIAAGLSAGDVLLIKLNAAGDTVWTKIYGGPLNETATDVIPTMDGGYAVLCQWDSPPSAGFDDMAVLKIDSSGNFQWLKTYGSFNSDGGRMIKEVPAGGYIITGTIQNAAVNTNMLFLRIDAVGNIIWIKDCGGISADQTYSVQLTADGGFVFTGYLNSPPAHLVTMKIDSSGNFSWMKQYSYSGGGFLGWSASATSDGGNLIVTQIDSANLYRIAVLIKTDSTGNVQWARSYGQFNNYLSLKQAVQTPDGGYILNGATKITSPAIDALLFKIDSAGSLQWAKSYGGLQWDEGFWVENVSGGGYIVAGYTSSFSNNSGDVYLVKTDASGNSGCYQSNVTVTGASLQIQVTAGTAILTTPAYVLGTTSLSPLSGLIRDLLCFSTGLGETEEALHDLEIVNDPFSNKVIIKGSHSNGQALLYTADGKKISMQKTANDETEIILANLANGFYVLSYSENNKHKNFKLVKLH